MLYPLPKDEAQRLQAVHAYGILDTPSEGEFDTLTRVAAQALDAPVAVIGLMDADRLWFKSCHGIALPELDRKIAFCAYTIMQPDEVLVVEDLAQDDRFRENPLVTHAPHLRFYAGAPLVDRSGHVLGSLAVVDTQPRKFGEAQRALLQDLAAMVITVLENFKRKKLLGNVALTDHLTALPNRRLFQDRLEREIRKSSHTGAPLALMLVDLDRFKEVNDALGHGKGDLLLIEASRRISGCVRDGDTVARLGGDEFAVILSDLDNRLLVERVAQNIIQELSKPFVLEGDTAYVSASVGITLYPDQGEDVGSVLTHAEFAMYGAKGKGRDQYCFFTAWMQDEAQKKAKLTSELRHALVRNELRVHYQPIVELATGKIIKAEALLRWQHPHLGMVSPAVFIPLAENSGLIHTIGDWVFQEAAATVARWHRQFGRVIQVGINKSPMQLAKKNRPGYWGENLIKWELPKNSINVEITEGALLKDSPTIRMKLANFRQHGMEVSIDDFGTGFSSLSYLKKFNVDYLKIDQSFVSHLLTDASDQAVTEAIIVMAHKLGIKTIAEGVETEAQRDMLVSFGCDYAQGYLYSPALPAKEFEELIARLEQNDAAGIPEYQEQLVR